jgi:TolB-like protein
LADIFLSYSREDQPTAKRFAEGFERARFTVWWDATLDAGQAYDEVTEKALQEAKAVVVLWSKTSVASRWVRAEATQANENQTLVPVMIEACKRPIIFELTHTADLSHWTGDPNDKAWQAYLAGLRRFVDKGETTQTAIPAASGSDRGQRFSAKSLGILAAVVIIAGGILWSVTRNSSEHGPTQNSKTAQEVASQRPTPAASAPTSVSLAVLPFVDMSPEHNQEYFSDGLSEELLNQLAQINELRVAGRTSSFSFKGKNEDMRVIGEQLGVGNLLEGSVRKDGNHLRITAQLINAKDGIHIWSQTYDRDLSGVFAVQEEIAKDVSEALSIKLNVGEMSRARGGTTNLEAYDKYLQAKGKRDRGDGKADLLEADQLFRDALTIDPKFGRAWSGLYDSLSDTLIFVQENSVAVRAEMANASAQAVALAPGAWWALATRANELTTRHKWAEAEIAAKATLAAAPAFNTDATLAYTAFTWPVGRSRDAVDLWAAVRRADPLSLRASFIYQISLCWTERYDELVKENLRSRALQGDHIEADGMTGACLAQREGTGAKTLADAFKNGVPGIVRFAYEHLRGHFNDPTAMRTELRKMLVDPDYQESGRMEGIAAIAALLGDTDTALAAQRRTYVDLAGNNAGDLWFPIFKRMHSDPRFKKTLRDLGLVDYWRTSGNWGDYCKPVGKDDFECH